MFNIFKKSYPLESTQVRLIIAVCVSIFVFLFLLILQPFDINRMASRNKSLIIIGYGAICFLVLLLVYVLLPLLFRRFFDENNWQVSKEILWLASLLVIIGAVLAVYEDFIGTRPVSLFTLVETTGKTIIIGLLPLTALVMLNQIRLMKKHLREAGQINNRIVRDTSLVKATQNENNVTIESDNQNESFISAVDDILFITSIGNYIEVSVRRDVNVQKSLLRTTLSKVESQLNGYPQFFRSHRSFIVNLNRISKVKGNTRGYILYFENSETPALVSKRKTGSFKSQMNG